MGKVAIGVHNAFFPQIKENKKNQKRKLGNLSIQHRKNFYPIRNTDI